MAESDRSEEKLKEEAMNENGDSGHSNERRSPERRERDAILTRAARISVAVGVVILALKVGAWLASGSTAVLSDAVESVVHVLATIVMLTTLQISQQPPDRDHPYGHGKAGSFSVGLEGGLVALSGALVLLAVIERVVAGHSITNLTSGLIGTVVAAGVNLALGLYLVRVGRSHESEILIADGQHVLADVWTSAGVLLGLVLVKLSGMVWIDWVVAVVVGVHLLFVGSSLLRSGVGALMDRVDENDYAQVVQAVNEIREDEWIDMHDLRLRRVGELVHVDFHLVVPGDWTIRRGHDVSEQIERAVLTALGAGGSVLVHLDYPEGHGEDVEMRFPHVDEPFTVRGALRRGQDPRFDRPGAAENESVVLSAGNGSDAGQ